MNAGSKLAVVPHRRDVETNPLVRVRDLTLRFGGITALDSISFDVPRGSIYGVIGPNGAGKTTFFNCLSRFNNYGQEAILFDGEPLRRNGPSAIAGLGLGRTFQNLALFPSLSVLENIMLGAHSQTKAGVLATLFRLPSSCAEERRARDEAQELAALVGLEEVAGQKASDLPFGFQKRVELARALASRPRLLMLDEPAAGLIHDEVQALARLIGELRQRLGLTVLLVEHHMGFVMRLCERIVVLNFGRKIAEGTPDTIRADPEVRKAYLGDAG